MEKKYYQSDKLNRQINSEEILKLYRSEGGHLDALSILFKDAELIAVFHEDDYSGQESVCVKLDNEFIIYNDYFGSCSGCDSWCELTDKETIDCCVTIANNALIFQKIEDVIDFLTDESPENKDGNYDWFSYIDGNGLIQEIKNYIKNK